MQRSTKEFERIRRLIGELKVCCSSRDLERGKRIHEAAVQSGDHSSSHVASTLINMYGKCGSMQWARKVFDSLEQPDVVSWTSLILGYADNGQGGAALDMFSQMRCKGLEADARTYVAALRGCCDLSLKYVGSLQWGRVIHLLASKSGCCSNIYVQGVLVAMYSRCKSMEASRNVFETMEHHDVVSWTALIVGYTCCGESQEAVNLFWRMRREGGVPNERTYVGVINACAELVVNSDEKGKFAFREKAAELHSLAVQSKCASDSFVQSSLMDLYVKCGLMEEALKIFSSSKNPDVVLWTALIFGYAENGKGEAALDYFIKMRQKGCPSNSRTFVAAVKACVSLAAVEEGVVKVESKRRGNVLQLLSVRSGFYSDVYVQGVLVDLYAKCGDMEDCRDVFNCIQHPNSVCWNSLLMGYADNGDGETVLHLFPHMREECTPSSRSFVAAVRACVVLSDKDEKSYLEVGKKLHTLACKCGVAWDGYLQGTLVDMYGNYGFMDDARRVFEGIVDPDAISWTSLIEGYTENGESDTALDMFSRMRREGCIQDVGIFAAALKACYASGALEIGKSIHTELRGHNFEHDLVIRTCLVNLYAKCGNQDEAKQVFDSHEASSLITWNSLMAGYGRNGDFDGVFDLFEKMMAKGLTPDGITFKCVLSACNHAGLVEKGRDYFEKMPKKHGFIPDAEHYNCMIDMLGRSNKLEEAMVLLRSMPWDITNVTWMTILGACRKLKNVELGKLAFEALTSLDHEHARAYVEMSNIQRHC